MPLGMRLSLSIQVTEKGRKIEGARGKTTTPFLECRSKGSGQRCSRTETDVAVVDIPPGHENRRAIAFEPKAPRPVRSFEENELTVIDRDVLLGQAKPQGMLADGSKHYTEGDERQSAKPVIFHEASAMVVVALWPNVKASIRSAPRTKPSRLSGRVSRSTPDRTG